MNFLIKYFSEAPETRGFSIDILLIHCGLFWNVLLWQTGNHHLLGQVSFHLLSDSWCCSEFFHQCFIRICMRNFWGLVLAKRHKTIFRIRWTNDISWLLLSKFNFKLPLITHLHLQTRFLLSREDNLQHWTSCSAVVFPITNPAVTIRHYFSGKL
jgi:hypothetical protein